jgi:signal transduction histidine kinase
MTNGPILVVDDEPGILRVLAISLEDAGYRVVTAAEGQEALRRFREIAYPPLVLTDIKMPGMDGLALLKAIKAEHPETEVIVMTGHGDMDLAISSLRYDATDFVTKPVDEEALRLALRRARERILLRRRLREYTENLERLVQKKTRELLDAERLAAVGETVADLAHAIKNIASGLEGGAFVLEKGLESDNREYLEQGWAMVKANVSRIRNLALDLLGFAKPVSLRRMPTDPNEPVREVVDLMIDRARAQGVSLEMDLTPDLDSLDIDGPGIHRALLNLVTNALEACSNRSAPDKPRWIRLSTSPLYKGVIWAVQDNCGGMPKDVQAKVFTRFFTTKGSQGTGLGLMMTQKIVEAHGGRIEWTSEPGVGSRFMIVLEE